MNSCPREFITFDNFRTSCAHDLMASRPLGLSALQFRDPKNSEPSKPKIPEYAAETTSAQLLFPERARGLC